MDGYVLSNIMLLVIVGRYLNLLKNTRYTCKEVAYHSTVFKQVHVIKRIFQFLKELEMKTHRTSIATFVFPSSLSSVAKIFWAATVVDDAIRIII